MCGEKTLDYPPLFKGWGSPPRVRGKVDARYVLQAVSRITPACAGKSHLFSSSIGLYSDHPRVCGEKDNTPFYANFSRGSPPRVRGKVYTAPHCSALWRITPACAGKRLKRSVVDACTKDHPRVCGEKYAA